MTNKKPLALIVDDEEDLCLLMQLTLSKMKIDSVTALNITQAKQQLTDSTFDFCLTDLNLPDGSGLDLVEHISEHYNIPVSVITAHGSMDIAIEALKLGAFDFVNKPLELPRLRQIIANALKVNPIQKQKNKDDELINKKLLGESQVVLNLKEKIKKLARSQAPVFIQGQSGTGKEVVASLIHELGPRSSGNFIPVNCGAIPSELMESEFFGHKKGSFTGAISDKQGLFQMADGGTLFLDEVADLPLSMQVKLLRAIQEKKIRPIGAHKEIAVDIRLLSATHKNLEQLVQGTKFRQDLYYRINVIDLKLPSLNQRGDDILLLARYFIEKISDDWGSDKAITLSESAKEALLAHQYQGNVRELRNLLERAITLCDDHIIEAEHLQLNHHLTDSALTDITEVPVVSSINESASLLIEDDEEVNQPNMNQDYPILFDSAHAKQVAKSYQRINIEDLPTEGLEFYLESEEKRLMTQALEQTKWNRTKAAEILGMSFRSFRYKMKKLGISDD